MMNKKKNPRGAGRKPVHPGRRKLQKSIRLPAWLWELLEEKTQFKNTAPIIIERAIIEYYSLNEVDIGLMASNISENKKQTDWVKDS